MNHHLTNAIVPLSFVYKNRAGKFIQAFLDGLKEKKIRGTRCQSCGKVFLPPRSFCGSCNNSSVQIIDVPQEGILLSYTIAYKKIEKGKLIDVQDPLVIGMVKLDSVDSAVTFKILCDPEKIKKGTRVRAVWSEDRKGEYSDLVGFEPYNGG